MIKPGENCASRRSESLKAMLRAIEKRPEAGGNWDEIAAKARGLMSGYHARWVDDGWNATELGTAFHLPIVNPATGRRSRTFTRAGRYTGLVERGGKRFLLVFRTVSESIDETDSAFWRRVAADWQSSTYCLGRLQQQRCVDGMLYDVVRRPAIRPRAIPKGSNAKSDDQNSGTLAEIQQQGTYFGRPLDRLQRETVIEGDGRETSELYSIRVEADTLKRPDWYFHRRLIRHDRRQLVRAEEEIWQTAAEIRLARRSASHWRNSEACRPHGRLCPYLPICSGSDTPRSPRWKPVAAVHPELGDALANVDPHGVLTHGRMQCFKHCRRKHYYRYELGIVPTDRPSNETLSLSRAIHRALAAWWRGQATTDGQTQIASHQPQGGRHVG